jgi:hypothetical protein
MARDALNAVVRRLHQVNVHWHEALSVYFEPERFRIAVQNCITTARTVTFILQSHKGAIADFDNWYARWQSRFANDLVMCWAKEARNKIEKQSDLHTLSQIRAELIAGYLAHAATGWATTGIDWSIAQILRSIPPRLLDRHVIDNGVLSVERRWVDSELPDCEVLDALAHVYGQLALLVVSLHEHLGESIPEHALYRGEHLLRSLRQDGRLPSMDQPLEDRAVYVAIKDGSILGFRTEFGRNDPSILRKAEKRYREIPSSKHLTDSSTLMEIANVYFHRARIVMLRDGYHQTMFIPLKGAKQIGLVVAPPKDRAAKYMIMRDIARYVRRIGADGLLHISEAWTARAEDIPRGGYPDQARNKGEKLMLNAANAEGQLLTLSAMIQRKLIKRHKVKRLGPTQTEEGRQIIAMAPVLDVWGKVEVLKLREPSESDDYIKDHFGHTYAADGPQKT